MLCWVTNFWLIVVHTSYVRVTVPDRSLRELLASDVALGRTWSTGKRQAQRLLHVLRMAESLAAAVRTGLLSVAVPKPAKTASVVVTHQQATLHAVACDANGAPVTSLADLENVQRLDILDIDVAGVHATPSRQGQP